MATFGPFGKQVSVSVLQVAAAADLAERRTTAIDSWSDVHRRERCLGRHLLLSAVFSVKRL